MERRVTLKTTYVQSVPFCYQKILSFFLVLVADAMQQKRHLRDLVNIFHNFCWLLVLAAEIEIEHRFSFVFHWSRRPMRLQCQLPSAAHHLCLNSHQRSWLPWALPLRVLRCSESHSLGQGLPIWPAAHSLWQRPNSLMNQSGQRLCKHGFSGSVNLLHGS